MDAALHAVLERLHQRIAREAALRGSLSREAFAARREEFMLAIGEDSGRFLNLLAKAAGRRAILEVGTAVGYSTLWLADAARETGGRVTSLDVHAGKQAEALANLREAGLAERVELIAADAVEAIAGLPGPFDLVLLDATRELLIPCFEALRHKLGEGALVLADNMTWPEPAAAQPYQAHVRMAPGWQSLTLPIGNGLELSRRVPTREAGAMEPGLQGVLYRLRALAAEAPEPRLDEPATRLLHLLALAMEARQMLELGTGAGQATVWLAEAARQLGGRVTTLDADPERHRALEAHLAAAGLGPWAEAVTAPPAEALRDLPGPFALVCVDAAQPAPAPLLAALRERLAPGGLLVTHPHPGAAEAQPPGWEAVTVPLGPGLALSRKPR